MEKRKKRRKCSACSLPLQRWGKTKSGHVRYRCSACHKTVLHYRQKLFKPTIRSLFKQYILHGVTYEMVSTFSGYSIRYLQQQFYTLLKKDPPPLPITPVPLSSFPVLLLDGLWFGRLFVLMVYRQAKKLTIIHISTAKREVATKIATDLRHILSLGFRFSGVCSDGGTGIMKAVHSALKFTPHQICLAHMHRQVVSAIGKRSKDIRIQELRAIADHVWKIESKQALRWWRKKLNNWLKTNYDFIEEYRYDTTNRGWYVHKGARKAMRILEKLPFTSFKFLDYPILPKTTNELEAQFGHLGERWLVHRGLKQERWIQFMKWFVYFYNEKKLSQKKY